MNRAQLFIGRLPKDVRRSELEDVFGRYGRVTRCDIRMGMETAYAFVDFDDHRDAKDALKYENGKDFQGSRIVVDWAIDDHKYGRYSKRATAMTHRRSNYYPRHNRKSRSRSPSPRRDDRRRRKRSNSHGRSRSGDIDKMDKRGGGDSRARSRSQSR